MIEAQRTEDMARVRAIDLAYQLATEVHVVRAPAIIGGYLVCTEDDLPEDAWPDRMVCSVGCWFGPEDPE